jgi:pimeloyl-ACP methyl ester carboxylesterase
LEGAGLTNENLLKREHIEIEMDQKPFKVWTITYGTKDKPTLVICHGLISSSCLFGRFLGLIAQHYRLVLFDNLNNGLNTKTPVDLTSVYSSIQASEDWMMDFMLKTMDALDLPEKFYITGQSYGGYFASIYAS